MNIHGTQTAGNTSIITNPGGIGSGTSQSLSLPNGSANAGGFGIFNGGAGTSGSTSDSFRLNPNSGHFVLGHADSGTLGFAGRNGSVFTSNDAATATNGGTQSDSNTLTLGDAGATGVTNASTFNNNSSTGTSGQTDGISLPGGATQGSSTSVSNSLGSGTVTGNVATNGAIDSSTSSDSDSIDPKTGRPTVAHSDSNGIGVSNDPNSTVALGNASLTTVNGGASSSANGLSQGSGAFSIGTSSGTGG